MNNKAQTRPMRIVIDMQGAQTESRFRGIGRYTLSFAKAVVRQRGEHEVILVLSGLFPETIEPLRAAFSGLLPQENIRVWNAPGPVLEEKHGNQDRRRVAEVIREAFFASLMPDVIHISSLFEGYIDDAITSIGRFDETTPVTVTLYDLIPLMNPDQYLKPSPPYAEYYMRKVGYLRRAVGYLAISEFAGQESMGLLDRPKEAFINVSTAVESDFRPIRSEEQKSLRITRQLGVRPPFILYTGGADERKNLSRLIDAFAALPKELRVAHQLVFSGKMPEDFVENFKRQAQSAGIGPDEICFTGYVTDEELVQLYSLCLLFVFPSWHEGFGLPALEAMACGAPVIVANASSLPEVVGLDDALFDPWDVRDMSQKMKHALESEEFRVYLRNHGLNQAQKFSWDETAKRAITAWEGLDKKPTSSACYWALTMARKRLHRLVSEQIESFDQPAVVHLAQCMAHNESQGLERQILIDVSELCMRDAGTGVQRVVRSYLKGLLIDPPKGYRIEPVYATLEKEGYQYARRFTLDFLGLEVSQVHDDPVNWQRGDIFFGLDMQHHVQLAHAGLYRSLKIRGVVIKFLIYDLLPIQLKDFFKDPEAKELHERWLGMISETNGAISISKATRDAYEDWLSVQPSKVSDLFQNTWVHIGADIEGSKPSKGLPNNCEEILHKISKTPSFLCVSTLEPRKGQQQIFEAFKLLWSQSEDVNLVMVGRQGWKTEELAESLRQHPEMGNRLFWLQGISDELLERVYKASTCLIAASKNEGFGLPLIEAARFHIPILARDIPVFREVAQDAAYFFKGDTPKELADAVLEWLCLFIADSHPRSSDLKWLNWTESTEQLKIELVNESDRLQQLFVDISELIKGDAKSGIQRVVKNILREWLKRPPAGFEVTPVYATVKDGYRYARQFSQDFFGFPNDVRLDDDIIEYSPGDIFFGLDLQPEVQVAQKSFYQALRRAGVIVKFAVYDLLCVQMPEYFPSGADVRFSQWLDVVAQSDGGVCISKSVASDLKSWVGKHPGHPSARRRWVASWFHLGADINHSDPSRELPLGGDDILDLLSARPNFLMVGTLEPRKGHLEVLQAFDLLWKDGVDVSLTLVGKEGWMVSELIDLMRHHPRLNTHLFWLQGISDGYLERIYDNSRCLIAASHGEGFGLPLIEAAQHDLPVIARDIPIFREVAGDGALFFADSSPESLKESIVHWISLYEKGQHPKPSLMTWLSWAESAKKLGEEIIDKRYQRNEENI